MKLGFDAKRAFFNNTGLGNYSRDTIRILGQYFSENEYHLYTPKEIKNERLSFLEDKNNITLIRQKLGLIEHLAHYGVP